MTYRYQFESLWIYYLDKGSAGTIYTVNEDIVLKCPILIEEESRADAMVNQSNTASVEHEKHIYNKLAEHGQHDNVLGSILCVPEGIFLPRMQTTLDQCLRDDPLLCMNRQVQDTWIAQLISAAAWLEKAGYVHGDLRPGQHTFGP